MNKTVVTHFYNEEYLLPWWLMHHREIFDHGILIDYDSTDRSVEIIKQYCPTWQIVTSRNRQFDAARCDEEVMDYESSTAGWKMCLNVTEFLVGDFSILNDIPDQILVLPSHIMVDTDTQNNDKLNYNESLIKQKPYGIFYDNNNHVSKERNCRAIHNLRMLKYTTGRHFYAPTCDKLGVLWYAHSPLTQQLMNRKLQIQGRIPQSDFSRGLGTHHITDQSKQLGKYNYYLPHAIDLSVKLNLDY
jgi:hypothetical protein